MFLLKAIFVLLSFVAMILFYTLILWIMAKITNKKEPKSKN